MSILTKTMLKHGRFSVSNENWERIHGDPKQLGYSKATDALAKSLCAIVNKSLVTNSNSNSDICFKPDKLIIRFFKIQSGF